MTFDMKNRMVIQTTVPLEIDQIQNLYTNRDKVYFVIDYKESALKEQGLLFYMSNLELPGDVYVNPSIPLEDKFNLIKAYMGLNNMIPLSSLLLAIAQILYVKKGIDFGDIIERPILTIEETEQFIEENTDLVDRWIHIMDSMYVYTLYVIAAGLMEVDDQQGNRDLVELNPIYQEFPHIDDINYVGTNFIYVFNIPGFSRLYYSVPDSKLSFFKYQFTEYCYKGENLYNYYMESDNWLLSAAMVLLGFDKLSKEDTAVEEVPDN